MINYENYIIRIKNFLFNFFLKIIIKKYINLNKLLKYIKKIYEKIKNKK